MKSEPKIVLVFLGVLLLGLGVVFLMLALESGPGDVNPIRLSFLLGSVGFSLSAGMVLGCLILMILSLVKLHCEGGLKGEFPSKSTQKQRLYASRVVGVLFIAGVISIHSVTMLSDHWPTNTPPKCLPGECVLGGVCTQKDCGSGTTESNCDCTCDVGFAGELCDICAENFEDGLTKCSRCQANYTGDDCRTLAYGH